MTWFCAFAVIWGCLGIGQLPAQHNLGYIRLVCEPGARVYVDGEFKGMTSEKQGGLIISSVSASRHLLRFEKEGYHVQEATVDVGFLKVLEYRAHPFTPKQKTVESGNPTHPPVEKKVGSILIQTLPLNCKINITALGVNGYEKYRDEVDFDKLPVGTYAATFSALGKSVDQAFVIEDGKVTRLFVDILNDKTPEPESQPRVSENAPAIPVVSGDKRAPDGGDPANKREVAADKSRVGQSFSAAAGIADDSRSLADLSLKLIWIAPGSFAMGNEQGESDEKPVTQVRISRGFWLGQTEVTQAQWREIMGGNPAHFQGDEMPVEAVNWNEVMAFCEKLTLRESAAGRLPAGFVYTLPSEAQWEYACRAGATGNQASDLQVMAWYMVNSGSTTKPVGQKTANAWGLYDMHGNVWEWCLDWYGNYRGGSVSDPKGAVSGTYRVMRGGSWNNSANYCRSGLRLRDEPVYRRNYLGFRVALSAVP